MLRKSIFALIGLIIVLTACEDKIIVNSPTESNYVLTIINLPEEIKAPEGVSREYPFNVKVTTPDGAAAQGITVDLSTSVVDSSITPTSSVTDSEGMIEGALSLQIPKGETHLTITATVNSNSSHFRINLNGSNRPVELRSTTETPSIVVAEGANTSIDISAAIVDSNGIGIPGVKLGYRLLQADGESGIFGSISGPTLSDSSGHAKFVFNNESEVGEIIAEVWVDEEGLSDIKDEILLNIHSLIELPCYISISGTPDRFENVRLDSIYASRITVIVSDENRVGIPNLNVNVNTNLGTISSYPATNEEGVIETDLNIRPGVDFSQFDQPTLVQISANIPGTELRISTSITFAPISEQNGFLQLTTDRRYVWADGPGMSQILFTVLLKNEFGEGISNAEVRLTSSFNQSTLQSPVLTDSVGRAIAIFDDNGFPSVEPEFGFPDSVTVRAFYEPLNLEASANVMIKELNPVTDIRLHVNAVQMIAGSGDSTHARATCFLASGDVAPAGIEIHFYASSGYFNPRTGRIEGISGVVNSRYIAGNRPGVDTLYAWVEYEGNTVISNYVLVNLISGPPASIYLEARPRYIDYGTISTISAVITDFFNNPVRPGTYVTFRSDIGMVEQSTVTNEFGLASVQFRPGIEIGTARITGRVSTQSGDIEASTSVEILGGHPQYLEMEANPTRIHAMDIGGNETSTISVSLFDQNGHPTPRDNPVIFEITGSPDPPEGPTLNDEGQIVEVMSSNGFAFAHLHSGTMAGSILINAYSFRDEARLDTIRAFTSVIITGGIPAFLDINLDEEGVDVGGGAWAIEASILVWDEYRNPIQDGIPVSLFLSERGAIEPVLTGNQNRRGESYPGIAFAMITYASEATFNEVLITARAQGREELITAEHEFLYPLQHGELLLHVDPENWMFIEDREEAEHRVWAILTDGHGVSINNAPILFTANRGGFWWLDQRNNEMTEFFPDPVRKFTGIWDDIHNEEDGVATVFLLAEDDDIFLDPFTLEVRVMITAVVEDYFNVSSERFIQFTRRAR